MYGGKIARQKYGMQKIRANANNRPQYPYNKGRPNRPQNPKYRGAAPNKPRYQGLQSNNKQYNKNRGGGYNYNTIGNMTCFNMSKYCYVLCRWEMLIINTSLTFVKPLLRIK